MTPAEPAPPSELRGAKVTLRLLTDADRPALARIFATPEVARRWATDPDELAAELPEDGTVGYTVWLDGRVAGFVHYGEVDDPMYRSAGIDIALDPAVHGRGIGQDTVRTVARYLLVDRGHHRLSIDPAADNAPAIRCYTAVGFRPVGVLRAYERGPDGTFHDGLLMDLLAEDFIDAK